MFARSSESTDGVFTVAPGISQLALAKSRTSLSGVQTLISYLPYLLDRRNQDVLTCVNLLPFTLRGGYRTRRIVADIAKQGGEADGRSSEIQAV